MGIELIAGNLGLDLANNRSRMPDVDPEMPYLGLLEVAVRSDTLSAAEASRLAGAARRRPADAAAVAWSLEDAICDVCELQIEVGTRGYVTGRDELTVVLCQTCGRQAGAAPVLPF